MSVKNDRYPPPSPDGLVMAKKFEASLMPIENAADHIIAASGFAVATARFPAAAPCKSEARAGLGR